MRRTIFRVCLILAPAVSLGCASRLKVSPTPPDAEISVRNAMTSETFEIGEGPQDLKALPEWGSTFVISVKKKNFFDREITVTPSLGVSSEYIVNLQPDPGRESMSAVQERLDALLAQKSKDFDEKLKVADQEMRDRMAGLQRQAEERLRSADEARQLALMDRMRAEVQLRNVKAETKVKALEDTFEVYKDALFSERYAAGPARADRQKIDNSVDYVTRIQQDINNQRYAEAEQLVDKLLERDEYFAKGYALKGTVKMLMGKPKESIVADERALELDPNDRATQRQLAVLYQDNGGRLPASNAPALPAANPPPASAAPVNRGVQIRDR